MFDKLFFTKNGQISESLALGIFLTLAGGFQDAYSYNVRDHVFANAQTGNIVLLGQNLASGNLMHALRYLLPLAAFFLGVYLTEWIKHFYKTSVKIHWRQIVLIIEILILGITGFLPNELPQCDREHHAFFRLCHAGRYLPQIPQYSMCNNHVHRKYAKCDRISLPVPYQQRSGDEIQKHPLWIYYSGFCDRCRFRCSCSAWFGVKAIWIAMAMQVVGFFMMFAHQDIEAFEKFEEEEKEKIRQTHARKK